MATTPNTDASLIQTILVRSLDILRESCLMPQLVWRYDRDREVAAAKGDTIQIPVYPSSTPSAITPGETDAAPKHTVATHKTVSLDQWYGDSFHLSDKDRTEYLNNPEFISENAKQKIRGLVNQVNDSILDTALGNVHNFVGTAGTTPFGAGRLDKDAIDAAKILNKNLADKRERYGLLDWDAWAAAMNLDAFKKANERGVNGTVVDGEIGEAYKIQWFGEDAIQTHTNGTLTDGAAHKMLVGSAGVAAGATQGAFDSVSLTGTVKAGELFTVAGDDTMYTVTEDATADTNAITVKFYPAAQAAWADGDVVTFQGGISGAWQKNIVFQKQAFVLVSRPLEDTLPNSSYIVDPVTGLTIRGQVKYQYYQTAFYFDVLWGTGCVRPELACFILG